VPRYEESRSERARALRWMRRNGRAYFSEHIHVAPPGFAEWAMACKERQIEAFFQGTLHLVQRYRTYLQRPIAGAQPTAEARR
jgi:hypothetical protein